MDIFDPLLVDGENDIPYIYPENIVPKRFIGFNQAKTFREDKSQVGIHFYLDDYQFERTWNRPEYYSQILCGYACVLTPDFSLYRDTPTAMQIWNHYRKQLLGQFFQRKGIHVIPTVCWSDQHSFRFCFDGIGKDSTVSISSVGVVRDSHSVALWKDGVREMLRRLRPSRILFYGKPIPFDYGGVEVIYYSAPKRGTAVTSKSSEKSKDTNPRTEFLLQHRNVIESVADCFGMSFSDRDDFFQEVLVQSMTRACTYDPSRSSISTYSHKFAQWVALKLLKESEKFRQLPEDWEI